MTVTSDVRLPTLAVTVAAPVLSPRMVPSTTDATSVGDDVHAAFSTSGVAGVPSSIVPERVSIADWPTDNLTALGAATSVRS